jgi:hypothetical protein
MRHRDKKAIQGLLWALRPLLTLRGSRSIPLPFATTFLLVVLDEGLGVNTYAHAAGIHRRLMSRYLRDIGARARNGGPGLGLITIERHPTNILRRQVLLTAKGRTVASQIFEQMRRAQRLNGIVAERPPAPRKR